MNNNKFNNNNNYRINNNNPYNNKYYLDNDSLNQLDKDYLKQKEAFDNVNYLKKITKNNLPLFYYRYNIYNIVLEKSLLKNSYTKFLKNKYRYISLFVSLTCFTIIYNILKGYYIFYYYIMYDIDIRKPKVSDYFIKRYR